MSLRRGRAPSIARGLPATLCITNAPATPCNARKGCIRLAIAFAFQAALRGRARWRRSDHPGRRRLAIPLPRRQSPGLAESSRSPRRLSNRSARRQPRYRNATNGITPAAWCILVSIATDPSSSPWMRYSSHRGRERLSDRRRSRRSARRAGAGRPASVAPARGRDSRSRCFRRRPSRGGRGRTAPVRAGQRNGGSRGQPPPRH